MSEDRPQYQAERTVPTPAEIAERLRALADDMHAIGVDMTHLGGAGYRVLGNSVIDRAGVFRTWAQDIEGAQG